MKESTKTAIDEILANMPKDLNKNTQIRYVYLKLAKKFRKDIAFFYGTDEEKSVIYPKDPKVDFSNQETLEIICRSSALIYKYVFSKIGVDVQLVEKPTKSPFQHVDLIITGEDDKKYYLSPMEDLFRIQLGMRTKRFGSKTDKFNDMENVGELSSFSEEEVKEMDNKLGYTYKGTYMDDVVAMIREEALSSKTLKPLVLEKYPEYAGKQIPKDLYARFKVEFLLEHMNYRKKIKGYIEYKDYFDYMLNAVLNKKERKKVKRATIYKLKEDGTKDLKILINMSTDKGHMYYVVTNESKKGYVKTADIADYMLKHDYQFIKDSKRVLETGNEEIGETPEL